MPVSTRNQIREHDAARLLAASQSHTNINNLPTEIIDEIASHLRAATRAAKLDGLDSDSDDGELHEGTDMRLRCRCRPRNKIKVSKPDFSLNLSSCSQRLRKVVFEDVPQRMESIGYCDSWLRESRLVCQRVRSNCKNLDILVRERHQLEELNNSSQLLGLVRLFPNVQHLALDWVVLEEDSIPLRPNCDISIKGLRHLNRLSIVFKQPIFSDTTIPEVGFAKYAADAGKIFQHLHDLPVRTLSLSFYEDTWFSRTEDLEILATSLAKIRFPLFNLRLTLYFVVDDSSADQLWANLERLTVAALANTAIAILQLQINFCVVASQPVIRRVFTHADDTVHMNGMYLPSEDQITGWFARIKALHPALQMFDFRIAAQVDVEGLPPCRHEGCDPQEECKRNVMTDLVHFQACNQSMQEKELPDLWCKGDPGSTVSRIFEPDGERRQYTLWKGSITALHQLLLHFQLLLVAEAEDAPAQEQ